MKYAGGVATAGKVCAAAALVAVVPMVIGGSLHPQFSWARPVWGGTIVSIISLAVAAFASEVAFRGFLFRRLIDATGPVTATILLSLIYAVIGSLGPNGTSLSFVVTIIAGLPEAEWAGPAGLLEPGRRGRRGSTPVPPPRR